MSKQILAFYLTWLSALILWSPVFPGYFGIPTTVLYVPCLVIVLLLLIDKIPVWLLGVVLIIWTSFAMLALLNNNIFYLRAVYHFPFAVLVAYYLYTCKELRSRTVELLTIFGFIALVSCWVAFFYYYWGGEPFDAFKNPDGRWNHILLGSFSNYLLGDISRVSFIYDEAGALSFVICCIVIIREFGESNRLTSFIMLLLGLVTLSVTHVMITLLYAILFILSERRFKYWLSFAFIVSIALFGTIKSDLSGIGFFIDRFQWSEGRFEGDNRSIQIDNFIAIANPRILLLGASECTPPVQCDNHGDISSSFVTPMYLGGVVFALIQVLVHLNALRILTARRNWFSVIAFTLILLQRPNFLSVGYSILIMYVFWAFYFDFNKSKLLKYQR